MEQTINRLKIEKQLWSEGYQKVMGLDEVGRGCLAGPVVAAGVIFKPGTNIKEIRDSKMLTHTEREELSEIIKEKAIFWAIKEGSIEEVNRLNILWASIETMVECVAAAKSPPDYLLVDGNRYTTSLIPYTCMIGGDDRSMSIGAASILAKVYRDEYMRKLHNEFPEFGWNSNVGYPTPVHRKALKKHGFTHYHRSTFRLGTTKKYSKV
ncbi:MAG: ribonuclease HII [Balneolaceae bacterium]